MLTNNINKKSLSLLLSLSLLCGFFSPFAVIAEDGSGVLNPAGASDTTVSSGTPPQDSGTATVTSSSYEGGVFGAGADGALGAINPTSSTTDSTTGDGGSGGDPANSPVGDALIVTGDATAGVGVTNEVNNMTVSGDAGTSTPEADSATTTDDAPATTTEQTTNSSTPEVFPGPSGLSDEGAGGEQAGAGGFDTLATSTSISTPESISVGNNSEAAIENEIEVEAESGENSALGDGSATIDSGDTLAAANLVNIVNTNFVYSNGALLLLNMLFGGLSTLDLRSYLNESDFEGAGGASTFCNESVCSGSGGDFSAISSSTAEITNSVIVRSLSGGNFGVAGGDALIDTGNAAAGANVVNIANTNIVNSNYLLLSVNNFGDWAGDLVFPGRNFFERIFGNFSSGGGAGLFSGGTTTIGYDNQALVSTSLDTAADSGGNSAASGTGSEGEPGPDGGLINTGEAIAASNVLNRVNTNVIGGNSVMIALRVHGNWLGEVFSAPEGLKWEESGGTIKLWSDEADEIFGGAGAGGDQVSASIGGDGTTGAGHSNSASIFNDIKVFALTGGNHATSSRRNASVSTGDAFAAANVLNVANTNIFGSNMILAVINIFGDWQGNIAFGRPDLWIGGRLEAPRTPMRPGDNFAYHFTIANRGDADATSIRLNLTSDDNLVWFPDGEWHRGGERISWNLGSIAAGGIKNLTIEGMVRKHISEGEHSVDGSATVRGREPDADLGDNTERLGFSIFSQHIPNSGPPGVWYTPPPDINVTKISNATTSIATPGSATYTVSIVNNGLGPTYHSELMDVLKNERGEVIHTETWPLGTVFAGEEITVNYTVNFSTTTVSGVYTNYAQVKGYGGHESLNPFYGYAVHSNIATTSIEIIGREERERQERGSSGAGDSAGATEDGGEANNTSGGGGAEDNNAAGAARGGSENKDEGVEGFVSGQGGIAGEGEEKIADSGSTEISEPDIYRIPLSLIATFLDNEGRGRGGRRSNLGDSELSTSSDFGTSASYGLIGTQTASVLDSDLRFHWLWFLPLALIAVLIMLLSESYTRKRLVNYFWTL